MHTSSVPMQDVCIGCRWGSVSGTCGVGPVGLLLAAPSGGPARVERARARSTVSPAAGPTIWTLRGRPSSPGAPAGDASRICLIVACGYANVGYASVGSHLIEWAVMPNAAALARPQVIQGGMGVAVSGWPLARAVASSGQLGVVSGTALEAVCARRLQQGDPGGHVRRALASFPAPALAERVLATYYVEGGIPAGSMFRGIPMWTLRPSRHLQELAVVANFVEVFLAKEGHGGPVGINFLRKIELPTPFACYGAMLAGVDYVLMGAGNPAEMPGLLRALAEHRPVAFAVKVQGATSADGPSVVRCSPRALLGTGLAPLRCPRFVAIVASVDLAAALAADPELRPDGYVVEGPSAGGHNAPPRGPRRTNPDGEPVYDDRVAVGPGQPERPVSYTHL